jgi:chromosomal replication initiator protein
VQFVAGKERTQEELFHVFNALYGDGKQLVFCSDRRPADLSGLEDRLRSRFEGGLVVEMHSPDRALREKLYARFLGESGVSTPPELLRYLADRSAASVREMIGTVNRLIAAAEVNALPLTVGFARAELEPADNESMRVIAMRSAADPFFLDDEKIVWDWSEPSLRLIEELR